MTRFTDRVTRDLHQIADRSTPSSTAWDSIRTRIDEQTDQPPTMEVIMLSPDRNDQPKRGWMLAAAAVAGLALVGGLVFATTRSDDDTVPADTPTATLPAEPAPDAEVDPDAEAVEVPAPEPTTAAEVAPEPEPAPEPVTVTVTGTYADSGVTTATTPTASSSGLVGDTTYLGTTNFEGPFAGPASFVDQGWNLADGSYMSSGEFLFTGAIEGLGSGTLSFVITNTASPDVVDGVWSWTTTITSGTDDFEGAHGTAVFTADAADPLNAGVGTYSWTITVPPEGSLVSVTATGTAVDENVVTEPGDRPGAIDYTGTTVMAGDIEGPAVFSGRQWPLLSGSTLGGGTFEFTGAIAGLGSGTMTFEDLWTDVAGVRTYRAVVTGGTGDFEGITGIGTFQPTADGTPDTYTYSFDLTAPIDR